MVAALLEPMFGSKFYVPTTFLHFFKSTMTVLSINNFVSSLAQQLSWICHRHLYFSPIFPYFSSFSTSILGEILDKRPCTCATHGIHVAVPTPRSQVPPSLTWLMRHQPALLTCLHSRPCFWTLGPRPLSIVPTISGRFRSLPISYHYSKFSHWATYTLGIPIVIVPIVSV